MYGSNEEEIKFKPVVSRMIQWVLGPAERR
jgi:hypothetical protein